MTVQKAAIVTGGGSGIGRAVSILLAAEGAAITVADTNEAGGGETVAAILAAGGKAQFVKTDVVHEAQVHAMVERAMAAYGRLDKAVNCAGIPFHGKPVHELSAEQWNACNDINLRGAFFCMKHEIAAMLQGGEGGAIVAISSTAALMGVVNASEYCASKAGVLGLVRGAAIDYAPHKIRVNAVIPGATSTPMMHQARANNPKVVGTTPVPAGRPAQPEEIAAVAAWLASDAASYVTGQSVTADGGMTIV